LASSSSSQDPNTSLLHGDGIIIHPHLTTTYINNAMDTSYKKTGSKNKPLAIEDLNLSTSKKAKSAPPPAKPKGSAPAVKAPAGHYNIFTGEYGAPPAKAPAVKAPPPPAKATPAAPPPPAKATPAAKAPPAKAPPAKAPPAKAKAPAVVNLLTQPSKMGFKKLEQELTANSSKMLANDIALVADLVKQHKDARGGVNTKMVKESVVKRLQEIYKRVLYNKK
jgi:hypothetical protein